MRHESHGTCAIALFIKFSEFLTRDKQSEVSEKIMLQNAIKEFKTRNAPTSPTKTPFTGTVLDLNSYIR